MNCVVDFQVTFCDSFEKKWTIVGCYYFRVTFSFFSLATWKTRGYQFIAELWELWCFQSHGFWDTVVDMKKQSVIEFAWRLVGLNHFLNLYRWNQWNSSITAGDECWWFYCMKAHEQQFYFQRFKQNQQCSGIAASTHKQSGSFILPLFLWMAHLLLVLHCLRLVAALKWQAHSPANPVRTTSNCCFGSNIQVSQFGTSIFMTSTVPMLCSKDRMAGGVRMLVSH